ncbi:MAG: TetR/AcrR family transcriptional regulator [Promicromonosporaceae bacterium]|nr:TetR/AcrR family transcriptional regulator [Promicromonosporaceae bacterium]
MTDEHHPAPPRARTARSLARETLTREIVAAARARLRTDGPAGLSLRAVARDVGMVSSAVYRYVPSRDALLTLLLVETYDELGDAVEQAEARAPRDDLTGRWLAAARGLRQWCTTHPGEFALLYGTPVPGYAAPPDTVEPATRVVRVLVGIAADAQRAGLHPRPAPDGVPPAGPVVAPARAYTLERGLMPDDTPDETVVRTLLAWSALFGAISFELFGHLEGSVTDPEAWYDQAAARLAADAGLA